MTELFVSVSFTAKTLTSKRDIQSASKYYNTKMGIFLCADLSLLNRRSAKKVRGEEGVDERK